MCVLHHCWDLVSLRVTCGGFEDGCLFNAASLGFVDSWIVFRFVFPPQVLGYGAFVSDMCPVLVLVF